MAQIGSVMGFTGPSKQLQGTSKKANRLLSKEIRFWITSCCQFPGVPECSGSSWWIVVSFLKKSGTSPTPWCLKTIADKTVFHFELTVIDLALVDLKHEL